MGGIGAKKLNARKLGTETFRNLGQNGLQMFGRGRGPKMEINWTNHPSIQAFQAFLCPFRTVLSTTGQLKKPQILKFVLPVQECLLDFVEKHFTVSPPLGSKQCGQKSC